MTRSERHRSRGPAANVDPRPARGFRAVGIIPAEGVAVRDMQRWVVERGDIRSDRAVEMEIVQMLAQCQVRTVVMALRILGCPHEEGVDYPDGAVCPSCPFWAGRDRWAGLEGG